ncbi:MAG TPA: hypothetical protein VKB68_09515 [Stellaceae bacterium]|nr:hypothetical protein [Stellaceae bacterium]
MLLGMLILIHASLPASARPWKPTPQALALDYAEIIHQRGTRDLVIIIWLVPQMLGIASEEARELLDQYALIGALHGHMLIGGTMSYDANSQLQAADDRGDALIPVTGDSVPPTVQGALTTWQGVLKKMIGPMGEGVQWFVFEAGRVHSCEKGGLSISFEGETYTYETPVPGCPVN